MSERSNTKHRHNRKRTTKGVLCHGQRSVPQNDFRFALDQQVHVPLASFVCDRLWASFTGGIARDHTSHDALFPGLLRHPTNTPLPLMMDLSWTHCMYHPTSLSVPIPTQLSPFTEYYSLRANLMARTILAQLRSARSCPRTTNVFSSKHMLFPTSSPMAPSTKKQSLRRSVCWCARRTSKDCMTSGSPSSPVTDSAQLTSK